MEDFRTCKSIEVGSSVVLKRYGMSAVKIGILWMTPEPMGENAYGSSGRMGERDQAIVLEVAENMARVASASGGCGWISTDKLARIS